MAHYVYILRRSDGSFYVGSARNLAAGVKSHNDGRGAAYTFKHRPVDGVIDVDGVRLL